MAVRQINTADYDYSMFLETLNKSYKGKSDITISEYDTDSAPDVKVGSIWEDNGAIFILETADLTPTGYAGSTNSTTFYLYYDESASVFIYSNTAPTWSDVLQGWYNSNDRAFFSMYKDSGGTLYQNKWLIGDQRELYNRKLITSANYLHETMTINAAFDKLAPFIPNNGDTMLISGFYYIGISLLLLSRAQRITSTTINLYYMLAADGALSTTTLTDGNATSINITISW